MIDKATADNYIERVKELGSKPGLERIQMLLSKLGNPEQNLKVIHVAGTNGKGSVCTMLQFALINNDYSVGKFSSPAVFDEYEQFQINGDNISEIEYLGFLSNIIDKTKDCTDEELPTYFEVQVAIALLFFQSNNVDFAIIETGMGGRLDATNVFSETVASVITSIGFDHMEFLGETLSDIASHKAGIIKKGCYAVVGKQADEALATIKSYASDIDAKLQLVDYHHVKVNKIKNTITYREFKNVTIPFFGDFQVDNTALALETLHILRYQRIDIDIDKAIKGLEGAYLPGRMERISDEPLIFIDGCHNKDAALRLKETINNHLSGTDITFIMGVLKDKEVSKMISVLLPLGKSLVTVTPNNPRALSASMLADKCFLYDLDVSIANDFDDAVDKALNYNNDCIIACGSLSYLKDIKNSFKKSI